MTAARHYNAAIALLDGTPARIRAVRPEDKHYLVEGLAELSPHSARMRFFTPKRRISEQELRYFTEIDFVDHVALAASIDENGAEAPIGIGRYIVDRTASPPSAEVAFTVLDRYQGRGVGTLLLHHLAQIARAAGIATFTAVVLAENHAMLEVFEHSGYPHRSSFDGDEIRVVIDIGEKD